jgi:hypothetical protein
MYICHFNTPVKLDAHVQLTLSVVAHQGCSPHHLVLKQEPSLLRSCPVLADDLALELAAMPVNLSASGYILPVRRGARIVTHEILLQPET